MKTWSPHIYISEGKHRGHELDTLKKALAVAQNCWTQGVPAVLTLRHLSTITNVPYSFLRQVVQRRCDPYRYFSIKKRGNCEGDRLICVPNNLLMDVQSWISKYILNNREVHFASCAYSPGSTIKSCASLHCGSKWLIKLDVRQFFESISEKQVYHIFESIGYGKLISFEMARICTRVASKPGKWYQSERWSNSHQSKSRYMNIPTYMSSKVGFLPQGAPTSPMLSNLVMLNFDKIIFDLSRNRGLVYSRYADDLIFSTIEEGFSRKDASALIRDVFKIMLNHGLRPNTSKTSISPPGSRKIVLGLNVDRKTPRLTKKFKRNLEQHFYYLMKYGASQHSKERNFESVFGLRNHIRGLLSYANEIEPNYAGQLIQTFNAIDFFS